MRYCGMCGVPLAKSVSGRERRKVSCVFIDLAEFSTLTRGFDPEELRDLADEILTVVAGVIEDFDGYIDAFRGDGLIALFGAPRSHPDDAKRAVLAAAAGLQAIEAIGHSRGYPLKGRAGVNTGIVIAGSIGSGRVRDYTVMGSAVNLASRLEAAAEPGEVWVGPETYQATQTDLSYVAISPVDLPGFPGVREAYRLQEIRERRDVDPYGHLPFTGRRREMHALREALDDVAERGRPREVWLVGEAGSGKTRLMREFANAVRDTAHVLWLDSRASSTLDWEPLAQQVFSLREGEESGARSERIHEVLNRYLPAEPRWHSILLSSLDLAPQPSWTRLERRSTDRTKVVWRDLLSAIARDGGDKGPMVLMVDNDQADGDLHEFLSLMREAEAPVLLVRTSRRPSTRAGVTSIPLQALSLDESMALLAQLANPAMQVATESLVAQVGGNPAYILELGRALSLAQEGSFSGSLASLLQARLDMIDPHARRLLAHAALTGERCWSGLLVALGGQRGEGDIDTLIGEHLLVPEVVSSVPGEVEFRFQSELLRHAVIRMVPYGERPQLHLRIASWLEENAPLSFSEQIADHFRYGGSQESAYAHYLAAADLAAQERDRRRATRLFQTIAELDVSSDLLAQSALTHAQSAIGWGELGMAHGALARAEASIGDCDDETCLRLMEVCEQLRVELREVEASRDAPADAAAEGSSVPEAPAADATSGEAASGADRTDSRRERRSERKPPGRPSPAT